MSSSYCHVGVASLSAFMNGHPHTGLPSCIALLCGIDLLLLRQELVEYWSMGEKQRPFADVASSSLLAGILLGMCVAGRNM